MSTEVLEQSADEALADDWRQLAIEHLQLDDGITQWLRNCGVVTLAEAVRWIENEDDRKFRFIEKFRRAVRQLEECTSPGGVDWPRYWSLRGWQLHHPAGAAREFAPLSAYSGKTVITRELLGNGGGLIRAKGTQTMSDLVEALRTGMPAVRGLGRTKLEDLFKRLLSLSELADKTRVPVGPGECEEEEAVDDAARPCLPQDARELPISVLSLGVKAEWLRNAGYSTVGELADADWGHLSRIAAIGPRTLRRIRERLLAFEESSGGDHVDWFNWSSRQNIPLLPTAPVSTAAEMLGKLSEVLAEMQPHLKDEHCRAILSKRICRLPRQQSTLEEIGQSVAPHVSRERIRQKEAALLRRIAGAMIWGRGDGLEVQIHPSFSVWWRRAAEEFSGEDDVAFPDFIERLAAVWNVSAAEVLENIAFISAVVTGDAQMPTAFRAGAMLSPALLRLSRKSRAVPLCRFRLGPNSAKLTRRGIVNLGQLVDAVLSGAIAWDLSGPLGQIATAVQIDGSLRWGEYQRVAGLPSLPAEPPRDWAQFAGSFACTVAEILEVAATPGRAARIFDIRTRQPEGRRPTLDDTARALGSYGAGIKREESVLLQELHHILIGRNFAKLPIWLDADWLCMCDEAFDLSASAADDYEWFVAALAERWSISFETVELAAPGLWAIFTGYPEGRHGRGARKPQPVVPPPQPIASRIRLRGFRRLH